MIHRHLAHIAIILVLTILCTQGIFSAHYPMSLHLDQGVTRQYNALRAAALQEGEVQVLVKLNVPFHPEPELSHMQALEQRTTLARTQEQLLDRLTTSGTMVVNHRYRYVPGMAMTVDSATLEKLIQAPEVESISEDTYVRLQLAESIPHIGADVAHRAGYTGQGWTIALLDSGIDTTHPWLQGKLVSEACYSTSSGATQLYQSTCPNGQTEQVGVGAGAHCTAASDCAHGTHMAGIAAGNTTDANTGGVAPDATLISIQVTTLVDSTIACGAFNNPCLVVFSSNIIAGLERVYELRNDFDIAAVNLSLGGTTTSSDTCDSENLLYTQAVDNVVDAGIAVVAASGNQGSSKSMSSPACISSAISVGATDDNDVVQDFSNSSSSLDLLAPGTDITSSIPGDTLATFSGTSMATPFVSGSFAVLRQKRPADSVEAILTVLKNTGVEVRDSRNDIVTPRIQLDAALDRFGSPDLVLEKTASRQQVAPEELLTYTLTATNTGTGNASGVVLSDPLPAGTTFVTASDNGMMTDGVVRWSGLTIPSNNGNIIRTFTVVVNPIVSDTLSANATGTTETSATLSALELTNTATAQAEGKIFTSNTLQTPLVIDISTIQPALVVEKTADFSTTQVGETLTYTYQITNTGNVTLTDVTALDDKLGTVPLPVTSLAPGEMAQGQLSYTVSQDDGPGPLENTVTVQGTSPIGSQVSATDTVSVNIQALPFVVAKTADVDMAEVGQEITYTYYITNTGNIELTIVSASDDKLGAVPLNTTTLAPGQRTVGVLAYRVRESDVPGPLENTVTVVASSSLDPQMTGVAHKNVPLQAITFPISTITGSPLIQPVDGTVVTTSYPFFDWTDAISANPISYVLTIQGSNTFPQQPFSRTIVVHESQYKMNEALPNGTYTWSVQVQDSADNVTETAAAETFIVQAPLYNIYIPLVRY